MNPKIKKMLVNWRVFLLLTFLVVSILAIKPQIFGTEGVEIYSLKTNSSLAEAGLVIPAKAMPTAREHLLSVDGIKTDTVEDYYSALSQLRANRTVRVETN